MEEIIERVEGYVKGEEILAQKRFIYEKEYGGEKFETSNH